MGKQITTKWLNNMVFESKVSGHNIIMDADDSVGGEDRGPQPKPLLLASLSGCTGMDVISILKKMKVDVQKFEIDVDAESTKEHPKYYNKIHLIYKFKGDKLPLDKIKRAVELSQEKYCGVSALLAKGSEITYEIKLI